MLSSHPVITSYFGASNFVSSPIDFAFVDFDVKGFSVDVWTGFEYIWSQDTFFVFVDWLFGCSSLVCACEEYLPADPCEGGVWAWCWWCVGDGERRYIELVSLEIRDGYLTYLNLPYGFGSSLGAASGGFLPEALDWR